MRSLLLASVAAIGFSAAANAASINVLWYTGGVEATSAGSYQAAMSSLASPGAGDPSSATWNITYWASGAMPSGTFNALVVASPQGSWATNPDYSALNALPPALGNRILATGQDADWHDIFGPGSASFDGPRGFLRDAINWAGAGTGMGAVFLGTDNAELSLFGLTGIGSDTGSGTDSVTIPAAYASYPINTGLTSAGLSNWGTSAHDQWTGIDTTQWTGINTNGPGGDFVTFVSASTGGGVIVGAPEPALDRPTRRWPAGSRHRPSQARLIQGHLADTKGGAARRRLFLWVSDRPRSGGLAAAQRSQAKHAGAKQRDRQRFRSADDARLSTTATILSKEVSTCRRTRSPT